jgi:hypothetical protein
MAINRGFIRNAQVSIGEKKIWDDFLDLMDAGQALTSLSSGGIETGITAAAGGTQAGALALSPTKSFHEVTVVATAANSVKLPLATGSGNIHYVKNSAAVNSLQVYGSGTDTIDGVATATGVAVAAGKTRQFTDTAAGKWQSLLGA